MRDQLRTWVKLAEIDGSARDLEEELKALPVQMEEMRADVERLDSLLRAERSELDEAAKLRLTHEEELSQSNVALSRAKAKGAKSKNAREVEAAEREMELVRRTIREREEERKRLAEAIDQKRESLQEREEKLNEFRAMFEDEQGKATVRLAELEAERDRVTKGRDEQVAKLPVVEVRRYDRIRAVRGSGVAEVVDGICTGCRMQVRPQQLIVLQRTDDIEQCPHCQRILYMKATIED